MSRTDRTDQLISESLRDLESSPPEAARTEAARARVLAHFDDLVDSELHYRPTEQEPEAPELVLVGAPPGQTGRTRRVTMAAAAVVVAVAGAVGLLQARQSSWITTTVEDPAESASTSTTLPSGSGLLGSGWELPAGLEIEARSTEALTLTSTGENMGISILRSEPGWTLEDRLEDLMNDAAIHSARRVTSLGGTFFDSFQVYVTSVESNRRQCSVGAPCVPLVQGSHVPTWLRAAYHHDISSVERRDGTQLVVVAWTDQPYGPSFVPMVNEVLDSLDD